MNINNNVSVVEDSSCVFSHVFTDFSTALRVNVIKYRTLLFQIYNSTERALNIIWIQRAAYLCQRSIDHSGTSGWESFKPWWFDFGGLLAGFAQLLQWFSAEPQQNDGIIFNGLVLKKPLINKSWTITLFAVVLNEPFTWHEHACVWTLIFVLSFIFPCSLPSLGVPGHFNILFNC